MKYTTGTIYETWVDNILIECLWEDMKYYEYASIFLPGIVSLEDYTFHLFVIWIIITHPTRLIVQEAMQDTISLRLLIYAPW